MFYVDIELEGRKKIKVEIFLVKKVIRVGLQEANNLFYA